MTMQGFYWGETSSDELKRRIPRNGVAIVPIGSTEQHGPHLPTGTDHIVAWELAKSVGERTGALVLPLLPYGFSEDHFPRAGTISLSAETLREVIRDIARSLSLNGVKHIVLLSGHAGHTFQLNDICYELNVTSPADFPRVHHLSPYSLLPLEVLAGVLQEEIFLHAEELETSLLLLLRPELVDMKKAVKEIPPYLPKGLTTPNFFEWLRIFTTEKFLGRDTKTGVVGDATLATKEKGQKILDMMVDALVEAVKHATA
jgi:creatinine amidohydrolase